MNILKYIKIIPILCLQLQALAQEPVKEDSAAYFLMQSVFDTTILDFTIEVALTDTTLLSMRWDKSPEDVDVTDTIHVLIYCDRSRPYSITVIDRSDTLFHRRQ